MTGCSYKLYFTLHLLIFFLFQSNAQVCVNKFSSLRYKGTTYDTVTCSIVTKNNEIISASTLFDYNGAGHIAKYSSKGTPIWSYQYSIAYFDFLSGTFFDAVHFSEMIPTADDGYLVAGNFDQILSYFITPHPVKKYALLAKIDKFGKVLWTVAISNAGGNQNFSNAFETSDGDYIAYMANDNGLKTLPGDHTYGRVFKVDQKGNIKWSTLLFTYLFDAGGLGVKNKRAIGQVANKNIVIGDVVHKTDIFHQFKIKEGNLHFMELDYLTGNISWETSYEYPTPATDSLYMPDIVNVTKLPDGKLSFITSLYFPSGITGGFLKKGANIITTDKGVINNIIAYTPLDGSDCNITGISTDKSNGNRAIFFNKHGKAILADIAADGRLIWQQGYDDDSGRFPANCFSAGKNGFNIFMSNNQSFETRLLITDAVGVDCINAPADIIAQPAVLSYSHDSVITDISIRFDDYINHPYPFKRGDDYPLIKSIDCQQTLACCTDITDYGNNNKIRICEGKIFVLPDSTLVQDSGSYYITYKTALGCDSIVLYKVSVDKDVSKLQLGQDTCLAMQTTIKLLATTGYDKYYWVNSIVSGSEVYTINHPGNFWVTVSNTCGTKTDSIIVYDQCNYPIYMPRAFTPNNDNLNEYFRVPSLNKNHLIRFRIFNRWGKLVFETSNPSAGWDGRFNNEPLPSNTFVYYLEMEGYSGKKLSQKGSFLLLR